MFEVIKLLFKEISGTPVYLISSKHLKNKKFEKVFADLKSFEDVIKSMNFFIVHDYYIKSFSSEKVKFLMQYPIFDELTNLLKDKKIIYSGYYDMRNAIKTLGLDFKYEEVEKFEKEFHSLLDEKYPLLKSFIYKHELQELKTHKQELENYIKLLERK